MKKIISFMFCAAVTATAWSQGLHVSSTGNFYVTAKEHVFVTEDLNVAASGDLTVTSATDFSGVLIVRGDAVTGDVSYERYVPTANWHYVSAPVDGQNIDLFAKDAANDVRLSSTGNYGVSWYNNTNAKGSRWEYHTSGAAGDFVSGKGYSTLRGSAGNFTFKGDVATADVTIQVPASPIVGGATADTHMWSVVGNPYPSFLPVNDGANATNNLLKDNIGTFDPNFLSIYFYNNATNSYDAINNSSPVTYVAPGQAFMVDPAANNSDFTFKESTQVIQEQATANLLRVAPTPTVTLSLSNGNLVRTTILRYFDNSTKGLDPGYDAGAFVDGTPELSIDTHLINDSKGIDFTIQCLPKSDFETSIVPLSIRAKANEKITFSSDAMNLPSGLKVILEDKVANTITDITSESHEVTVADALNGIGRFYLHTASSVLSLNDASVSETLNIYKTSNYNLRISGLQQEGVASVKMYTTTGKQVLSKSFEMETVNDIAMPKSLSAGIYLVQLVANGVKQTKKLIIE